MDLDAILKHELERSAAAAQAAVLTAETDLALAVHSSRKSLRKLRALVELLHHALPRRTRRATVAALRDARRELGAARDRTVIPQVLETITLEPAQQDDAAKIIAAATVDGPSDDDTRAAVAHAAKAAGDAVREITEALDAPVDWPMVSAGIAAMYRRAREERRASRGDHDAFHRWRRRNKELLYQLEALERHAGAPVAELRREVEAVSDGQGRAVDLIALRELVRQHRELLDPTRAEELLASIDRQLEPLVRELRETGKAVFERRGSDIERHIRESGTAIAGA